MLILQQLFCKNVSFYNLGDFFFLICIIQWYLPILINNSTVIQYTHKKVLGQKNNPTLTQALGHYGTEHVMGWFDPNAGFYHVTQMLGC